MPKLALNGGAAVRTRPWPQWPEWGETERVRLQQILESGEWGGYSETVQEFERAFAKRHQARHCIAVVNGTLSLEAALRVLGIGRGDEVIVPPYTFIATANAVRLVGATPVFVDIEPDTYNIDASAVAAAVTARTRAIIPVHFAGHPADMDALMQLADAQNLSVIEDAAHAHGSTWQGRAVGAIGHIGSFSSQASKNLTAGEGGILLTDSPELHSKLYSFVNQGRAFEDGVWYEHPILGSNLRISAWQAGILLAQLERMDEQLQRRMANARRLHAILEEIDGLRPMRWDTRVTEHAHHLFMMRYNAEEFGGLPRERLIAALNAEGIDCSAGYRMPLYKQPPLNADHSIIHSCPVAEQACQEVIWLTQNMLLAEPQEMDDIAHALVKIRENIGEIANH